MIWTSAEADLGLTVDGARAEYEAYRARQARALVQLLPPEGIRPMYRRALGRRPPTASRPTDPLAVLLEYCEELLPLPPFDVWKEDVRRNPSDHLRDVDDSAHAPTAAAPATLEVRTFEWLNQPWSAHLRSFRDREGWRGYIAFEERRTGRVHRTALIFHEADPTDLRERFLAFESISLGAFLRSALP